MRWLRALVVVAIGLLTAGCAAETGPIPEGRYSLTVITQNAHTIPSGQVSLGQIVVAGGAVTLESGAVHRGTVLTVAGDLLVNGTVEGDLVALGGAVTLGPESTVTGDVQVAGADVTREPGAVVGGDVTEQTALDERSDEPAGGSVLGRIARLVVTSTGMAAAAWLVVRLLPRASERVRRAAMDFPVVSGALGTLVLLTAPAFLVAMAFTLILIPLALVLLVPLALIVGYGLVGLGLGVGRRLTRTTPWRPSRQAAAAWGTGALVAALHIVAVLPAAGFLAFGAASAVGTGAALLTGLGSRAYIPPADTDADDGT